MSPGIILKQKFGYESFRHRQEEIINSILQKKDTFVIMPTGGGKSLCYQIPALIFDGLTIVISPLIALMKDQVDALRVNGIEAAYLNSTQTHSEQDSILKKVKEKKIKLLYLAPERLMANSSAFLKTLSTFNVSLIAIDEAHCISHWGHDFRPEYLTLAQLKKSFPGIPVVALTATADNLTQKDIVEKLELRNPAIFISSFNRANIRYTVKPKLETFEKLLDFLDERKDQSGIIYCLSRSSTERIANDLVSEGFKALPYHAGLDRELRTRHQDMFLRDEVKIMVATIAFGMGIDKSNVRYVVHMDLPKNIESYYQETGRAGRDGVDSEALLFYSHGDVMKLKRFVQVEGNEEQTAVALKKLDQMSRFGELVTCRRKYLLNYFDESAPDSCGNCDVCLSTAELYDATILAQKAISAVMRLQQRFGAAYVIDFLRGAPRIQEDHKTLKTFGVGADVTKDKWQSVIWEMVERGYLERSEGLYPVLKITTRTIDVLKGEKVMLIKSREIITPEVNEDNANYETELFQQLKAIRREIAFTENVPAYIVVSDATLIELSAYLPQTSADLQKISGFGEIKIQKYGKQFLDVINQYLKDRSLESRIHLKKPKQRRERTERDNETKQETLKLFIEGKTAEEIAASRDLSKSTVENHLAFYITQRKISIDQVLSPDKYTAIREAIKIIGANTLSPIKESLGENYSYGEIRYVLAHLEISKVDEGEEYYLTNATATSNVQEPDEFYLGEALKVA